MDATKPGSRRKILGIVAFLAVLAALLAGSVLFWTELKADGAPVLKAPAPRLIAGHRGATRGVDENTIPAFSYALPYADVLEMDVRLTSDKKMVIMHDATLDRTTNCAGRVSSRTLAYIKACRTPRGSHPPSLRQFLAWADAQTKTAALQLELKGAWTQDQVQRFVNEVASYDLEAAASSFSTANLAKVERANDSLPDETAGRHLDTVLIEGGDPTMPPFLICDSYAGYANSISYLKKTYVDALQQVCNPPTYAAVYGSIDSDPDYQTAYDTTADMWIVEDAKDARRWLNSR